MIVPMSKVHVVARTSDRDALLAALRQLGVVHLVPVDPEQAVPDEQVTRALQTTQRALQALASVAPRGPVPDVTPSDAAHEVLELQRRAAESRNRLAALYHQLEQIEMWGNLELERLEQLRDAGIDVRFYELPAAAVEQVGADCAEVVARLPGRWVLLAVAHQRGPLQLPAEAKLVPLPSRDAPSIRAEAAQIDAELKRGADRLHALAHLTSRLRVEQLRLQQQADQSLAVRGAVGDDMLFALQGWVPAETAPRLDPELAARGVDAAVAVQAPEPDEQPPTLVRPPAWAQPIEGLFQILGTIPGYREFDVSIPFLIALPIFTAILIGDAGYGALLLGVPALAYARVAKTIGPRFTQLLMIVGAVSLVWGAIINSYFGFPLAFYSPLISIDMTDQSRNFMMALSFVIGAVHLSLAQLWQAVRAYPNLQFLNRVGWAVFIWGMFGVVRMFVLGRPLGWHTPWPYLLSVGAALAILFASPSRNVGKMLLLGVANFPLSMLSAFSDVISYVRLMAVGLASSVLAVSFNEMAQSSPWLLAVPVFLFGHGLNLGLALIAMFAHGVRLNMLEFCNNLGMQWTGEAYRPFTQRVLQEQTQ